MTDQNSKQSSDVVTHTPGPWEIQSTPNEQYIYGKNGLIAKVNAPVRSKTHLEDIANSKLILSAPTLSATIDRQHKQIERLEETAVDWDYLLGEAKHLKSEDEENPEYDRALVDLVYYMQSKREREEIETLVLRAALTDTELNETEKG